MRNSNELNDMDKVDMDFYYCGSQSCSKGHSYGPAMRDHYLIHYIHSGTGTFTANKKTYCLKEHQGFLICPGEVVHYKADEISPWSYTWVAFKGKRVSDYLGIAHISSDNPVFSCDEKSHLEECLHDIILTSKADMPGKEIQLTGLTYILISHLINAAPANQYGSSPAASVHTNNNSAYVQKAVSYIYKNYWRKITIAEIARFVMLERKYFSKIFKKEMQVSPISFLTQFRMRKACELLKNKKYSVREVARSVGYTDPLEFSKAFKKYMKLSPTEFKSSNADV